MSNKQRIWVNINGVGVVSDSNKIWKLRMNYGRQSQTLYSNNHNELLESIRIGGLINRDCIHFTLEYVDLVQEGFKKAN